MPEKIYIAASWKQRGRVRALACALRNLGHVVYDFTDPNCRKSSIVPPEKFPELFDPEKHDYAKYLDRPEWRDAILDNIDAVSTSTMVILLLPCGIDATADWGIAVGMNIPTFIIGFPINGERHPTHLLAHGIFKSDDAFLLSLEEGTLYNK